MPGLRRCQSRDSGLAKTVGIPGFKKLQSLMQIVERKQEVAISLQTIANFPQEITSAQKFNYAQQILPQNAGFSVPNFCIW